MSEDNKDLVLTEQGNANFPVTTQAIQELTVQRELLKTFISSQLDEANFLDKNSRYFGSGDYGVIPGTKKPTLLKQGAEKLLRLFQYGVKFDLKNQIVDIDKQFAMFTYSCTVYRLANGSEIANAEGSVNSQERKYQKQSMFDIMNTLQKMAQKRALVAATILATGASEYFTQDLDDSFIPPKPSYSKKVEHYVSSSESATLDASFENSENPMPVTSNEPPVCCGKKMYVSMYEDKKMGHKPWYCASCKRKVPRV